MHLSKRLETCLRYTEGFQRLADIGTDHAMLPIEAVLRGNVMTAIAIDNKFGPYLQARTNVKKYQVENRVKVVLGDGLDKVDSDTDVVVISGLGGDSIATILEGAKDLNVKRFVLQANNNAYKIRASLSKIGYALLDELVLADQDVIYDVLVLEPGQSEMSELELEFGPINLRDKPHYFIQRIHSEIDHYKRILSQVTTEDRKHMIQQKIDTLETIADDRT